MIFKGPLKTCHAIKRLGLVHAIQRLLREIGDRYKKLSP